MSGYSRHSRIIPKEKIEEKMRWRNAKQTVMLDYYIRRYIPTFSEDDFFDLMRFISGIYREKHPECTFIIERRSDHEM